ncbi:MAG: hypothetical protein QOE44_608 [Solirubrobacteraceae bacterium]|nr:hypothetical protein [Solirubrobacteraceae bacterium]
MRSLAKRADVQASALAAAAGLIWLLACPRTPDLAAQSYRVGLFERAGFAIWDNGWYAGHHVPAYSLLFPPLGAELGMRVVGAAAAVLAAFCFARLALSRFGPGARSGILWFALATASDLAIGRLTYALGAALGLAALLALQRGRELPAGVLAGMTAAATPLAGLFLGLAGTALFVGGRRRMAAVVALPALGVAAGLALVFPEGGRQPFGTRALLVSVLLTLAFVALTPDRVLRIGGALYLAATLAAFVLVTPIGGNTTRLGAVLGGPLLLCARSRRTRGGVLDRTGPAAAVVPVVLVGLFAWQWYAPVREVTHSLDDRLSREATYRGLFGFLAGHGARAGRVEVPFTRSHWEAAFVAARYPLARGWEKQLDAGYNGLFFHPNLSSATYHEWLRRLGIRYVAVATAPSDPSSRAEVRLVLGGLPYLRPVYRDPNWRVFGLTDPEPLASPPARLTALGLESFTLRFARPGTSQVRVRFSPYWRATRGCVARAPGGYTQVTAGDRGPVRVTIAFSLGRVVDPDPRCSAVPRRPAPGFSPPPPG